MLYTLPLLISAIIVATLGLYAWRYRELTAALPFALLMLAALIWVVMTALEFVSIDLQTRLFWANMSFIGITPLPALLLALILDYTGQLRRLRWLILASLIVPVLTNILLWTNDLHHLWRGISVLDVTSAPFPITVYDYGPWFYWVQAPIAYLTYLLGFVILVRALISAAPVYRRQIAFLLSGFLLPLLTDGLYVLGISPVPNFNLTPVAFSLSGLIISQGLFRHRFLRLMPVARDAIVESIGDAVIVLDTQNYVVDLNPATQRFLDQDYTEQVGEHIREMFPKLAELLARYAGKNEAQEEIAIGEGEAKSHFDLRISPVYRRKHLAGRLVVLRDISERKYAEEALLKSEERYRTLFEAVPIGIGLTTKDGRVLASNAAMHETTGYRESDYETINLQDTYQNPEDRLRLLERLKADGFLRNAEVELRRKDGTTYFGSMTVVPYSEDGEDAILTMNMDISARKQAEMERERLIKELDAYAHTVAHDLKNPVSLILGFAMLLAEDLAQLDGVTEEHQESVERIIEVSAKMGEIIDALLLLAGVRTMDKPQMVPLNMAAIVAEASKRMDSDFKKSQAEVTIPDSWPEAAGHAPWVEEVWANYLSNALKYGGKPPRVVLGADLQEGGMVRFWVRDNGAGLSQEEQAQLFRPFTRLSQEQVEGHGLGLSIVRRIANRLGGEVGVDSALGEGSTFWFSLPPAGGIMEAASEKQMEE
jgi:PAS domain S-box-containing protein